MNLAKEVSWCEKPRLHTMVEKLATKAGVPKPSIYVVPGETPNAFAAHNNPDKASITVTEGLLTKLFPEQRKVLLTREFDRIKNRTIALNSA